MIILCSCATYSCRIPQLFVHNRYTAALLCMASSIEFVSMTQWIIFAKARELICWIQGSFFLYCEATTCFMERIQSTVERSLFLFLQKGCVCIYREACNQILKCPCTVCSAWSDIYTDAHTQWPFCTWFMDLFHPVPLNALHSILLVWQHAVFMYDVFFTICKGGL